MVKKGFAEKPSSTNITPTSDSNKENPQDEKDGVYVLTNNFSLDFHELAKQAGFSELRVLPRPVWPMSKSVNSSGLENVQGTAKDKKEELKAYDRTLSQSTNQSDTEGTTPMTFLLKDKYNYFKPCVQAQFESYEGKSIAKEVYIRGWKIDHRIMQILSLTLPTQDKLVIIDFNDTGLTDDLLEILAVTVKSLPLLRKLCLDGNPVHFQRYNAFLAEDILIQNLSLRNCLINDEGASHIAQSLPTNKHLLTLNLCMNKISCMGVAAIAKGLRTNRTLLSLNLGCNLVKDTGASLMAEVISRFALSHDETVARRVLMSKKVNEEPSSSTRSSSHFKNERPPSVRSGSTMLKEQRKDKGKSGTKKDKRTIPLIEDKIQKKASSTDTSKDAKKGKKSSMAKVDKKGLSGIVDQEINDPVEYPNPLLEPVEEIHGKLYIQGNRALINLNLSGNKISEVGVKSLLEAIQYQSQLFSSHTSKTVGVGLLRLSLKRNDFSMDSNIFLSLQDLMLTRDPLYKGDLVSHDGSLKEIE